MRKLAWAVLVAVLLAITFSFTAYADQAGTTAITLTPAGGTGARVRLRAQTVDVSLAEDASGVTADTRVWLQLSNPYTQAVTLTLALSGGQVTGGALPADLRLKLGDLDLIPQPAQAPATGQQVVMALAGQEQSGLQLNYTQVLPETGGRAVFAYPLSATSQWGGGTPESLRVTVNFSAMPTPEQILGQAPEPEHANSQTLVWSWEGKAAPDVWLAFMKPSWWANFSKARAAASAPDARPAEHLALSQLYQQLAALPPLSFLPDLDFYARYYPAAVAELQAAAALQAAGAPAAVPDQITAHSNLARLYRDQANRLGRGSDRTYLELAAAEAQAALSLGASDGGLHSLASDAYLQLAAEARDRGDVGAADDYLARLAALEPASRASSAAEEQKVARLKLAAQQVARGSFDAARQIVTESFGKDAVDVPALRPPLARQILASVETTVTVSAGNPGGSSAVGGQRKIALTFADGPDPAAVTTLINEVGEAWRPVSQATITPGKDTLTVAFVFADDRSLGEIQTRLARLLPADAELALLSAVLSPQALSLRSGQQDFQAGQRYLEVVDLAAASEAWQGQGQEIRTAGRRLAAPAADESAAAPTPEAKPAGEGAPAATPAVQANLREIQLALWDTNAQAWESLAGRSYARYSVALGEEGPTREWQVPVGMQRTLSAQTSAWRGERLAMLAAGGVLLLLLVAFIVWRWL